MSRKGFTLVEIMIAMFISTFVIFALISTFTSGVVLMKKSGHHLKAQQEAIIAMNKIGDTVRESMDSDIYNFTPPLNWSSSPSGNFLVVYGPYNDTSAFYYVENKMYCVPNFSQTTFSTNERIFLASGIKDNSFFSEDSGSICMNLKIRDNDNTNITLFDSITWFTPRN